MPSFEAQSGAGGLGLTMAEYIPIIQTERDCRIWSRLYSGSPIARVSLETLPKTSKHVQGARLWIDAGIDGLENWPTINESFRQYLGTLQSVDRIVDPQFQARPTPEVIGNFVKSALDRVLAFSNTDWISVPQLPCIKDASRNRINRLLASQADAWKSTTRFAGDFIVPVVITHSSQIKLKAERTKRIDNALAAVDLSKAAGVWIVDASLYDQDGSSSLEAYRFGSLVALHEELLAKAQRDLKVISGPYWGLNLVLWCRGLATHPAIGLGNSYQYHLAGGFAKAAKSRVALPGLRRWAVANPQLRAWLENTIEMVAPTETAHSEMLTLLRHFSQLSVDGRMQVATYYQQWLSRLSDTPNAGRSLALYQDLSSAYVLGKGLPDLPSGEGTARRPERVAKQLMLFCL